MKIRWTHRLIGFGPALEAWLRKESQRLGISVSELVRRVLDKERERK